MNKPSAEVASDVEYVTAELVPPPAPQSEAPQRRRSMRGRGVRLPVMLFVLTCASTWFAGATNWMPLNYLYECAVAQARELLQPGSSFVPPGTPLRQVISAHWFDGLVYMLCVQSILLAHEMGHFVYTLVYRVRATLPYFLPLPIVFTGTMGAVIAMDGQKPNRREIFDIGIAGPLAGLIVVIPVLIIGIIGLRFDVPQGGGIALQLPLAIRYGIEIVHPNRLDGVNYIWLSQVNPFFVAGWLGMLVTALNMLPVSQLDGGHITYTLWGRGAHWVARIFMVLAIAYITFKVMTLGYSTGLLMAVLVLGIGTDHPPTSNDLVPLGWFRTALGYASLAIPVLCLAPDILYVR